MVANRLSGSKVGGDAEFDEADRSLRNLKGVPKGDRQADPGAPASDALASDRAAQHYAAIVESSDDAILS